MNNDRNTYSSGASESDIKYHYDIGNEFYKIWLDRGMNYSSALWDDEDADDNLEKAQLRKLDYHIESSNAPNTDRVLDIGCGWGSILFRLIQKYKVKQVIGLTLSKQQKNWVQTQNIRGVKVYQQTWQDHQPTSLYNAIISIGAFEHFTHPGMSSIEKTETYRIFFRKCASWLSPGSRLSLQTITHGCVSKKKQQQTSQLTELIFPGTELPLLGELCSAAEGTLVIRNLINHSSHYQRTCEIWYRKLHDYENQAITLHGKDVYQRYRNYLRMSEVGFACGNLELYRIILEKPS